MAGARAATPLLLAVVSGLIFAVPVIAADESVSEFDLVQRDYDQLIADGTVERPYLGITFRPVDPNEANELGVMVGEGAMVERVEVGSPVANAGLRVGDIIVAIEEGNPTELRSIR